MINAIRLSLGGLSLVLCAGCATFPAIEDTVSPAVQDADFVPFATQDELAADALATEPPPSDAGALARAARLSARAAALRGPVIAGAQRARLMRFLR